MAPWSVANNFCTCFCCQLKTCVFQWALTSCYTHSSLLLILFVVPCLYFVCWLYLFSDFILRQDKILTASLKLPCIISKQDIIFKVIKYLRKEHLFYQNNNNKTPNNLTEMKTCTPGICQGQTWKHFNMPMGTFHRGLHLLPANLHLGEQTEQSEWRTLNLKCICFYPHLTHKSWMKSCNLDAPRNIHSPHLPCSK